MICKKFNFVGTNIGFDDKWYKGFRKNFMKNLDIDEKGGVIASPDLNDKEKNYGFDWTRDAALSMRTYMEINDM
jgi:hypothetical protein